MVSLPFLIEVVPIKDIYVLPSMKNHDHEMSGPPLRIFAAAQLQCDLHVIGEDVVEILHSPVQWVPSRFICNPQCIGGLDRNIKLIA